MNGGEFKMGTTEMTIKSFDGTSLYLKKDIPDIPRAAIVIVHGLCEHQGRYDYLTEKFTARGFSVYRFDHRGHGKSEGKQTFYSDFSEIVDDVNVVVDIALKESREIPVFLLGHSMGGYAVALYGTKYPGKVKGIVTSGALTRYNFPLMGNLPINLPPDTYFPNSLSDGVCSDPAVVEAYVNDPMVVKQISASLMNSIYYGVEYLKNNAKNFTDPVLILHGCFDGLVSEKDSRDFYGDIASKDKTLKIYAHLLHEIFNEPSRDEVIEDVIYWLEKKC